MEQPHESAGASAGLWAHGKLSCPHVHEQLGSSAARPRARHPYPRSLRRPRALLTDVMHGNGCLEQCLVLDWRFELDGHGQHLEGWQGVHCSCQPLGGLWHLHSSICLPRYTDRHSIHVDWCQCAAFGARFAPGRQRRSGLRCPHSIYGGLCLQQFTHCHPGPSRLICREDSSKQCGAHVHACLKVLLCLGMHARFNEPFML